MEQKKFVRTDLAKEAREACNIKNQRGISYREEFRDKIKISEMEIVTREGSRIIGKPIGRYITLECGKPWLMEESEQKKTSTLISEYIKLLSPENVNSILVAGLGNRSITSDAVGPMSLDMITVTRHIAEENKKLFDFLGGKSISAIAPGVLGQTGIETSELIRSTVERIMPDLVLVIDALAARSVDRLARTVQLSDTGLSPGSGIGNRRREINKQSIGVPVISIGVPTVVDSATLVYDALNKAGIEEASDELKAVLENGKSFFVTLKESDIAVRESAKIISDAVNNAFLYN